MKSLRLCWLVLSVVLCASGTSRAVDSTVEVLVTSGDYESLLDSLRGASLAKCDSFFNAAVYNKDLTSCELASLTWVHATILSERNEPVRAISKVNEGRALNRTCNSTDVEVKFSFLLGNIYRAQSKKEEALKHFLVASRLDEKLPVSRLTFEIHYQASLLQYQSRNFAECIALLQRSLKVYEQRPDLFKSDAAKVLVMKTYNTLGLAYRNSANYPLALEHFRKSRELARSENNAFWVGLTSGNMGSVFKRMHEFDSAKYYLAIDTRSSKEHAQWQSLAHAYFTLASIEESLKHLDRASKYYDSIDVILKKYPEFAFVEYYEKQSKINYEMGRYKAAADFYRLYHLAKDSLDRVQASKSLSLIQSNYEFDKKVADFELIKKDYELQEKELAVQRGLLFGSISTVLLLFLLVYLVVKRYNQKRRAADVLQEQIEARKRELNEINTELDTFLYRASHDFRGPLSTLIGLNHIGMLTVKDDKAMDLLAKVADVARVMDKMLNKIAAIHIINREVLTISTVNVHELCREIIQGMNGMSEDVKIIVDHDINLSVKTDAKLMKIVLENLIENAVKFGKYKTAPVVRIKGFRSAHGVTTIAVSDNGKGIDEGYREKIFQPFVRADNEQKGNGLGLFLVKKCLQKLGGEIRLETCVGNGSTFTVLVPDYRKEKTMSVPVREPFLN